MREAPPLGELLAALGMSGDRFARRLNDSAEALGRPERVHPKTPYKWIKGEMPRPPWRSLATLVLSKELGRPITVADLGWQPDDLDCAPATAGLQTPWTLAGALRAVQAVTDAGPTDRRYFLLLTGASLTSPAHEWLIAHPAGHTTRTARASVPAGVVDHLDQITAALRRIDDQIGGGQLLHLVHEHLRYVTSLLRERRYDDTVGRRLHATAGELLRLAGWLSFDSGQHPQAQRYWVAGLHAAHAAGDRALGANIVGSMSLQAKDIGQIRESVTLAETARAGYPGATPRVAAMCDLRAAEAYACDRADTDCRRALDRAFDRLGDAPSSSGEPAWCYWLDEAQTHAMAGFCYLRLQDWSRARQHLRTALRLQDPSCAREGSLRHILLAHTYLRQDRPDVDHATILASQALQTLSGAVDSARCLGHLSQLITNLAPYRGRPAVRQLTENAALLTSR